MWEDTMINIPAGTRVSVCKGCGKYIYWVVTDTGKRMPVSIFCEGGEAPTATSPGCGQSHFADCPSADRFRGGSKAKKMAGALFRRPRLKLR